MKTKLKQIAIPLIDLQIGMHIRAVNLAGVSIQGKIHSFSPGGTITVGSGGVFIHHPGWTFYEVLPGEE